MAAPACCCCGLAPVEATCRKYCAECGPQIRAGFKGRTRAEYRALIAEVRLRAEKKRAEENDQEAQPPSREWIDGFFAQLRAEYPILSLPTTRKAFAARRAILIGCLALAPFGCTPVESEWPEARCEPAEYCDTTVVYPGIGEAK